MDDKYFDHLVQGSGDFPKFEHSPALAEHLVDRVKQNRTNCDTGRSQLVKLSSIR